MEKTRKIQSIIQDVIEGRKDNNEATIDILALCVVSQQRELFEAYEKHRDYDHYMAYKKVIDEEIEEFVAKNCG